MIKINIKKILFLSVLITIFFSCNESTTTKNDYKKNEQFEFKDVKTLEEKYEEMKDNRNDTLFKNFTFQMSEREVEKHVKEMRKKGEIKSKKSYNWRIGNQRVKLTGYGVDFFPSDYVCNAIFEFSYSNNKLSQMKVIITEYPGGKKNSDVLKDVISMFQKKYGSSQNVSGLFSEKNGKFKYYTEEGNKAIAITSPISSIIAIEYYDLISMYEIKELMEKVNDILEEENKKKSNDQIQDI